MEFVLIFKKKKKTYIHTDLLWLQFCFILAVIKISLFITNMKYGKMIKSYICPVKMAKSYCWLLHYSNGFCTMSLTSSLITSLGKAKLIIKATAKKSFMTNCFWKVWVWHYLTTKQIHLALTTPLWLKANLKEGKTLTTH